MICERSELERENFNLRAKRVKGEKLFQKISIFLGIHPQEKPVLKKVLNSFK